MFEKNVIVDTSQTTKRKYAEIYCKDNAEMITIDTSRYVAGTQCVSVSNSQKAYRLSAPQGSWYDSSGAAVGGYNTDLGNITKTLTKLTATGNTKAYYGVAANVTLIPDTGYDLPETIVVGIGEATGVADTDYTYSATTGAIVIIAAKLIGAITITAVATASSLGDIGLTLGNVTATGDTTATYGSDVDVTLVPGEGYNLPATIVLTINSVEATVSTDYTYSTETGVIHIAGAKVLGAVTITAVGTAQG